jgi:hypothetical protein
LLKISSFLVCFTGFLTKTALTIRPATCHVIFIEQATGDSDDELKKVWREAVKSYLKLMSKYELEGTEGKQATPLTFGLRI